MILIFYLLVFLDWTLNIFAEFPVFFSLETQIKLFAKGTVSTVLCKLKHMLVGKFIGRTLCVIAFIAVPHLWALVASVDFLLLFWIFIGFIWKFRVKHKFLLTFSCAFMWRSWQTFIFGSTSIFFLFFVRIIEGNYIYLSSRCFLCIFEWEWRLILNVFHLINIINKTSRKSSKQTL